MAKMLDSAIAQPGDGLFWSNALDSGTLDLNILHHNTIPVQTKSGEWSVAQRPTFETVQDESDEGLGRYLLEYNGRYLALIGDQYFSTQGATAGSTITGIPSEGPSSHTGADNQAVLQDTGESWTVDELVGRIIYNETDGSSATITANTATTVTGTLAGGTDNDWDGGDTWVIKGSNFNENIFGKITLHSQAGDTIVLIQNPGSGSDGYELGNMYWAPGNGTLKYQITDVDMPGNNEKPLARGVVSLNGYAYVTDIFGNIHNCNLDDVETWDSTDFIVAERQADPARYIGKHRDHVVWFGTRSIEFFYDAGNTNGSPLERRQDIYYNVGCPYSNSVVEIGDIIYFVGIDSSGAQAVYKLENFQLTKISNWIINYILGERGVTSQDFEDTPLTTIMGAVHTINKSGTFYILSIDGTDSTGNGTYAIHLETGFTAKWYTGSNPTTDGTNQQWTDLLCPIIGSTSQTNASANWVLFKNGHLGKTARDGNSFTVNDLTDLTLSAPFCGYYTHPMDMDTNQRKRMNSVRVIHYPSLNDDSWINGAPIEIAYLNMDTLESGGYTKDSFPADGVEVDLDREIARVYRQGIFRQRMYRVELTPNKRQVVKGLEFDYDILRG